MLQVYISLRFICEYGTNSLHVINNQILHRCKGETFYEANLGIVDVVIKTETKFFLPGFNTINSHVTSHSVKL